MLYILCFLWFYKDNETSLQNYLLGLLGLVTQKRSYKLKKVQMYSNLGECLAEVQSTIYPLEEHICVKSSRARSSYTFLPISKGLTSCEWAS